MGRRKKRVVELTCKNCQHFLLVKTKPACDNILQEQGKLGWKILESLKICSEFWLTDVVPKEITMFRA